MKRLASIVCGLLSITLIGYAGYLKVTEGEPSQAAMLLVQDADRDLGSQPSGAVVPVQFRLTNPSAQPIRVVGLIAG